MASEWIQQLIEFDDEAIRVPDDTDPYANDSLAIIRWITGLAGL